MKKNLFALLVMAASVFSSASVHAQCNAKELAKKCKNNLKPFSYDGYADNPFTFTDKEQNIEVEFTAYAGQQYKLVFCTSGFKEDVKVNIYDRTKKNPSRQKVYDSSAGIDNLFWSFEPKKTGTYYIEYTIPPAAAGDVNKSSCMVLLIGYK
ncbi:MAG TPA: hypothetical protein VGO45_03450 [Bacteroidia bacterium]|jgi:hypothetical protein|nr:hypothetical protein [Bacteroidia bacterium]